MLLCAVPCTVYFTTFKSQQCLRCTKETVVVSLGVFFSPKEKMSQAAFFSHRPTHMHPRDCSHGPRTHNVLGRFGVSVLDVRIATSCWPHQTAPCYSLLPLLFYPFTALTTDHAAAVRWSPSIPYVTVCQGQCPRRGAVTSCRIHPTDIPFEPRKREYHSFLHPLIPCLLHRAFIRKRSASTGIQVVLTAFF